ncbi:MAG TPA: hypothetical protein PLF84_03640 [Bryobacteraceae bacterium]|nr:hypothetical protein [Bryobacterales bacterium]HRJ18104.1 hypothetical protein [Bryobacteraceae bacterium]
MPQGAPAPRYPAHLLVVLAAVVLLAFSGLLRSIQTTTQLAATSRDPYGVELALRRFAPARTQLPPGARVAYFTDVPLNSDAGVAAFLATQHALAPCLLLHPDLTAPPEFAIGNFSRPQNYQRPGYDVAADLGNGVILYRRVTTP